MNIRCVGLEAPAARPGTDWRAFVRPQSDIARLMRVVVSHLYNDRDVFVRELRALPL